MEDDELAAFSAKCAKESHWEADHFEPPSLPCNCCSVNRQREKAWLESTTFQERYEAVNNPSQADKRKLILVHCSLCVSKGPPHSA